LADLDGLLHQLDHAGSIGARDVISVRQGLEFVDHRAVSLAELPRNPEQSLADLQEAGQVRGLQERSRAAGATPQDQELGLVLRDAGEPRRDLEAQREVQVEPLPIEHQKAWALVLHQARGTADPLETVLQELDDRSPRERRDRVRQDLADVGPREAPHSGIPVLRLHRDGAGLQQHQPLVAKGPLQVLRSPEKTLHPFGHLEKSSEEHSLERALGRSSSGEASLAVHDVATRSDPTRHQELAAAGMTLDEHARGVQRVPREDTPSEGGFDETLDQDGHLRGGRVPDCLLVGLPSRSGSGANPGSLDQGLLGSNVEHSLILPGVAGA